MQELSDAVSDANLSSLAPLVESGVAKPEVPSYVAAFGRDLEVLLDVAFALRSVPEDEIVGWLEGKNRIIEPVKPHKDEVAYLGQPVQGIVKEYEVGSPSGERYRLVVHPKKVFGVQSNEVKVKFSKTYSAGTNPAPGEWMPPKASSSRDVQNKRVLHLLPLVAHLPVNDVSYQKVSDFFEKNNGFEYDTRRHEKSSFRDEYVQVRPVASGEPLILKDWNGQVIKPAKLSQTEPVWMDVYVNVYNEHRKVRVELEVVVPMKKVA